MATKHEIEIFISPDGQVKLDIKGVKGPSCMASLKALADQVGIVTSQELKSEYYETETGQQRQSQKGA